MCGNVIHQTALLSFNVSLFPLLSALLDALMKNGSSAGNGTYRRRAAENSETNGTQSERENPGSGVGDPPKSFTKEQVEGVQR